MLSRTKSNAHTMPWDHRCQGQLRRTGLYCSPQIAFCQTRIQLKDNEAIELDGAVIACEVMVVVEAGTSVRTVKAGEAGKAGKACEGFLLNFVVNSCKVVQPSVIT